MYLLHLIVHLCTFISCVLATNTRRSPIDDDHNRIKEKTFDYIIVGAGVSGLVVANRLTEDPRTSVLVIERGYFDNKPEAIIPYYGNFLDTSVMIRPRSAPVSRLNNLTVAVAVAAVVGGGSVVNGMGYNRGAKGDYDAWEDLGNPGWGWNDLLPYFKKSTTFYPPSREATRRWNMTWDPSLYGRGPVGVTIPNFQYADIEPFWEAWRNDPDVPVRRDFSSGHGTGTFWLPSTIDPRGGTRVTSRSGYYDPVFSRRPNLQLVTGQTVTEVLFQNLRATGVQIQSRDNNQFAKVYARKEVILAAGAIQTPQLLQVSGIGPKDVLEAAGIPVKKDFPGVGANFQDHSVAFMIYNITNPSFPNIDTIDNNATYNATVWAEYNANRTGPIALGRGSMLTFLSLRQLLPNTADSILEKLRQTGQNPSPFLPSVYSSPALLRGFKAQVKVLEKLFRSNDATIGGFPYPGGGFAPTAIQKPLSRGTITLNLTDPHGLPVVQYNTLQNPIDLDIILQLVKRARRDWKRPELAHLGPVEISPGPQYQTDEEIISALTKNGVLLPTIAHPSGSAAMLPEEYGGVVGPDLRVYGVKGLSIVDASILPLIPGGALQGTMYAVAEKAADLIKARG